MLLLEIYDEKGVKNALKAEFSKARLYKMRPHFILLQSPNLEGLKVNPMLQIKKESEPLSLGHAATSLAGGIIFLQCQET